jgi:hypothetical protein
MSTVIIDPYCPPRRPLPETPGIHRYMDTGRITISRQKNGCVGTISVETLVAGSPAMVDDSYLHSRNLYLTMRRNLLNVILGKSARQIKQYRLLYPELKIDIDPLPYIDIDRQSVSRRMLLSSAEPLHVQACLLLIQFSLVASNTVEDQLAIIQQLRSIDSRWSYAQACLADPLYVMDVVYSRNACPQLFARTFINVGYVPENRDIPLIILSSDPNQLSSVVKYLQTRFASTLHNVMKNTGMMPAPPDPIVHAPVPQSSLLFPSVPTHRMNLVAIPGYHDPITPDMPWYTQYAVCYDPHINTYVNVPYSYPSPAPVLVVGDEI